MDRYHEEDKQISQELGGGEIPPCKKWDLILKLLLPSVSHRFTLELAQYTAPGGELDIQVHGTHEKMIGGTVRRRVAFQGYFNGRDPFWICSAQWLSNKKEKGKKIPRLAVAALERSINKAWVSSEDETPEDLREVCEQEWARIEKIIWRKKGGES